jgi:2-oxoglutarate dehydrogenase complex dehydrogenase (E1) component-like enzyme
MGATDLTGPNAAYVAQLLADYLMRPASVPPEWRALFEADGQAVDRRGNRPFRPCIRAVRSGP